MKVKTNNSEILPEVVPTVQKETVNKKQIHITYEQAAELLTGLQSIDGVSTGPANARSFTPFVFSNTVVDAIVENILTLREVSAELERYRKNLIERTDNIESNAEELARANRLYAKKLQETVSPEMCMVHKADLNTSFNRIPISVRVAISPIVIDD